MPGDIDHVKKRVSVVVRQSIWRLSFDITACCDHWMVTIVQLLEYGEHLCVFRCHLSVVDVVYGHVGKLPETLLSQAPFNPVVVADKFGVSFFKQWHPRGTKS